MPNRVTPMALPMPLGLGSVNCYLLQAGDGFVLVDTGAPNARARLVAGLEAAGCRQGSLRLVVLTHGDFDHTGNAAYLRATFGSQIGMHACEARAAETGDMFVHRKTSNALVRVLVPILTGFGASQRFTPEVQLADGDSLEAYGLKAGVIEIPGHSPGSIGILTAEGDLLCGDLFENTRRPMLNSLVDDPEAMRRSAHRLEALNIRMVYPGHGASFPPERLSHAG